MAITYPMAADAFIDLLDIEEATFTLQRNDEMSGLGNGQPIKAELASPLWMVQITTGPISNDDAEALAGLVEALEHPGRDFYVYNPRKKGPRSDPNGSALAGFTPTIHTLNANNRQMRIEGLPAGYVLSRGDMISWDYGNPARRAVHRILETVTASGAGLTGLFDVFPHIRPGSTTTLPVTLYKPSMRAMIVPGSYSPTGLGALHQRLSFSAIQKLR